MASIRSFDSSRRFGKRNSRVSMKYRSLIQRSRRGEGGQSSRRAIVAVIVLAIALACAEREVSGARDGSFRSQIAAYMHRIASARPG